jgi:archaellum component FlaC
MKKSASSTEIDDVLSVLDSMMTRIDERFNVLEDNDRNTQNQIGKILENLDSFAKRLEISEDERLVMGHQLDRLNRWTQELADKIGHTLTA